MHPDDLNIIWVCCDCGRNFVFNSDVEDHKRQFNHSCMTLYDLRNDKKAPSKFTTGKASLVFKIDGEVARVKIEYRYYPSNDRIIYVDVRYTHPKLESMIENNAEMMRKIDNYIRRLEQMPAK